MSKLLFIGAGKMGSAIAGGIVRAGLFPAAELAAFDVSAKAAADFTANTGVRCGSDVQAELEQAENVLIAVKPQYLESAIAPLKGKFGGKLIWFSWYLHILGAGVLIYCAAKMIR